MIILFLSMQYSGAQKVPGNIEVSNLPPSAIDENGEQPEVQGEEPTVNDDDDEPEAQGEDETKPEEQPTDTDPRKGVEGGLDIANTTQQSLPPAFKITIKFEGLWPSYLSGYSPNCNLFGCGNPGPKKCADWNLVAYVQGKLVKISEVKHYYNYVSDAYGLEVCIRPDIEYGYTGIGFVPSVTVEIPGESVEFQGLPATFNFHCWLAK